MVNLKTDQTDTLTPEQKLWKAVLAQSVWDSLFGDYKSSQTDTERKESKEWLNINNENFKQVCENAGFNHEFVFNLLKKKGKLCLIK
jgi:trans-2-enoyl-CoA reductase